MFSDNSWLAGSPGQGSAIPGMKFRWDTVSPIGPAVVWNVSVPSDRMSSGTWLVRPGLSASGQVVPLAGACVSGNRVLRY